MLRFSLCVTSALAVATVKEEVLMFFEVGPAGSGPMPSVSQGYAPTSLINLTLLLKRIFENEDV